jgi:hypothetical protein
MPLPFPTYSSGTVSVDAGGTLVTGTGVYWSRAHARRGDIIKIDNEPWELILDVAAITSPEDAQELTIEAWHGAAKTDVPYVIGNTSREWIEGPLAAADVHRVFAALNSSGFEIVVHPAASEPDMSDGDDGQYAWQPATGKRWVKVDGEWVFLGTFAPFQVDPDGAWTAEKNYGLNNVITRLGRLYYAKRETMGDPPESSPDDWGLLLSAGDRYDIAVFDTDRPASGEQILKWVAPTSTLFPQTLGDSQAKADVASTGTAVFLLAKNGVEFATLTFEASATGVFACAADTSLATGDVLSVTAPNPRDATLSGVAFTLVGFRS